MGEHTFYGQGNMVYGKAMEAAKSNALVRCCKDLGIASELWDPKVYRNGFGDRKDVTSSMGINLFCLL